MQSESFIRWHHDGCEAGDRFRSELCGAFVAGTASVCTSQGIITSLKMIGSGHTFTCRPRCPPWGLIHAVFGVSPLLIRR